MLPIADWLEKLGLSEYAQRFADNDIDFTILRDLTDQDLEKIGIASLGHRRKLLRAIANLEPIETGPPAGAVEAPTVPLPLESAERRQVTVMFSDLVGSTALSARMDPEDLREVIAAYHRCAAEIVRRFGGFVAQYQGDGVLVYFGYPQAHEDDAERAVRAGLELIGALGEVSTHASLQTRIGIATGLVVVGDLMDSGSATQRGIVGETPNLAARLQGIAEPGAVVIAEGTRKLLGNLFELVDLGARDLKGIAGPVRAWAVMRASSIESRFDALHGADLTALVGREENPNCCCDDGQEQRMAKARWCFSPVRPALANRGSRPRFWNALPASRTTACAISVLRSTPTARSIPSSARWKVPPDLRTTTRRKRGSTSSMHCSRRLRHQPRTQHSLPRCCRSRTMAAIQWSS